MMKPDYKNICKYLGRMVLSGAIFLYLVNKIDWSAARSTLASLKYEYILIALIPTMVELVLKSVKWRMLLKVKNIRVPFWEIFKIYYISSFIGTFLPSSLGIDLLRSYSLSRYIRNTHDSVSTVVVDRLLGIISLIFVVLMGVLAIETGFVNNTWQFIITIIICLFVLFGGVILSRYLIVFLEWILYKLHFSPPKIEKYVTLLHRIYDSIIDFKNNKWAVFKVFLVSIVFQFSRVAISYFIALSFDIHIGIKYWIIIVPLVTLATMLPLAVGGIGIREGAFVFFLSKLGVSISTAFLLSIVTFLLVIIISLPGFVFYLLYGLSMRGGKNASPPVSGDNRPAPGK
ncbi:MAG TPA: lysylphosphatidylglycerol synthase transmembrane domain-containing protein [bacterium]|nr:lysylphosphatidylglycerol synthase transmembrane domain-containing protein [bacterium]HPN44903.1 lysylphosphatidylglycerol synthase transmembrane domain-containing protein [bacterium]